MTALLRCAARITLALTIVICVHGCGSDGVSSPDAVATWEIRPDPPDTGRATVIVALADSAGKPIRGASVVIEGVMTHPGMAPKVVEAHEVEPGRYEAEMRFTMRGDWILLLEASLPDGSTLARQKELLGVGAR